MHENPMKPEIDNTGDGADLVRAEFEVELAVAADRLGVPVPELIVAEGAPFGPPYVDADNDGEAGPWVCARTELAGMPTPVREWAWVQAVAQANLPQRPAWCARLAHGLNIVAWFGVVTALWTLAAFIAVLAGAPVRWLATTGLVISLLMVAVTEAGNVVLARHERHRVLAADEAAAWAGFPIPPEAGRWLEWPPSTPLILWSPEPSAHARYQRQLPYLPYPGHTAGGDRRG